MFPFDDVIMDVSFALSKCLPFVWCWDETFLKNWVNSFVANALVPILLNGLNLILARKDNHLPYKVWDEIVYLFLNKFGNG